MPLGRSSWSVAARAVALVALVGLAATALRRDPPASAPAPDDVPAASAASAAATAPLPLPPAVDRLPEQGGESRLPRHPTPLPPEIRLPPATTVALSDSPVGRALALFEVRTGDAPVGSVLVLGDDHQIRRLDVAALAPATDANGNAHTRSA